MGNARSQMWVLCQFWLDRHIFKHEYNNQTQMTRKVSQMMTTLSILRLKWVASITMMSSMTTISTTTRLSLLTMMNSQKLDLAQALESKIHLKSKREKIISQKLSWYSYQWFSVDCQSWGWSCCASHRLVRERSHEETNARMCTREWQLKTNQSKCKGSKGMFDF